MPITRPSRKPIKRPLPANGESSCLNLHTRRGDDRWESRRAEGYAVTASIPLLETPGHTPQDITTLVGTRDGIVAFTHLWWSASGPAEDPSASDAAALHQNRERVLRVARLIVPGHGAPFLPDESTPR